MKLSMYRVHRDQSKRICLKTQIDFSMLWKSGDNLEVGSEYGRQQPFWQSAAILQLGSHCGSFITASGLPALDPQQMIYLLVWQPWFSTVVLTHGAANVANIDVRLSME